MDNILINSENSKAEHLGKYKKSRKKTIDLKYLLQNGIINLDYLMGHILYVI